MSPADEFTLDDEADKLYQMLGGIDTTSHVLAPPKYDSDGFLDSIAREEEIIEATRVLLVDAAHHLGAFLKGVQLSQSEEFWQEGIRQIVAVLGRLAEIPGRQANLVLRFRGHGAADGEGSTDRFDYTMALGNYTIDLDIAREHSRHQGIGASHLPGRLRKAFMDFSALEISALSLEIGNWGADDIKRVTVSLQGLAAYYKAVAAKEATGNSDGLVYNENRRPDPNLTVLALINRIKIDSLQKLVGQVEEMMYSDGASSSLQQCVSVYDAIFVFKKFRDQLLRPAVEINNVRWLMVSGVQDVVSRDRVEFCHALTKVFDHSPQRVAEIIESVYGSDYRDINVENLANNLRKLTAFLLRLEKEAPLAATKKKVIGKIGGCLDRVGDDVFDAFSLPDRALLQDDLFALVSFFKRRVATSGKVRRIMAEQVVFNAQDMQILARDLGIDSEEARQVVAILQACFTADGHFNRRNFENNIEVFLTSEKKIFAFLWHYLKEIRDRNDRITFLNSLQLLISKMARPQNALDILLRDVVGDPETVRFSDRNALILSNILIRKYNKELHKHIELTPEEVLLVKEGLNLEMTAGAGASIDQDADRFFRKTKTLHRCILDALAGKTGEGKEPMPLHYVVSVEREAFILLALIGGRMPHKILQSAVREYGDPDSTVYGLVTDQTQMKAVLGLLQLAIRGLARFKTDTDLKLLQEIRYRKGEFHKRYGELIPENMLDTVMEYADSSMAKILEET